MAGNDEDMKNEQTFLNDLSKINSVSLNGDQLSMKTSDNKELVFKQKPITYSDLYQREFILENKYPNIGITLAFDTNKIYGFSGVNRYFAGYTLTNENMISISPIGSTMMAGPEENMNAERDFTSLLPEAYNITLSVNTLEITTKSGEKLIFRDNSINDNKLLGRSFKLHNLYKYPNAEITMSFYGNNNQVIGFSGVNNYKTSYTNINKNEIKFDIITATKISGSKEDMEAEETFYSYIDNAKYMYSKGRELLIILNDSTILRFIENYFDPKVLNGKQFKLSNMFEGTEITLSIMSNSFTGKSGVNNYNIPFELDDDKVIISKNGISTLMAGPEEDMKAEDKYLSLLNNANHISYDDNILCIRTSDNEVLLFDLIN